MNISIKSEVKDFKRRLKKFRKNIPGIGKKLMVYVFQKMRNDIKKNIKSNFKRRKGWLYADLNYFAFDDLAGAIFTRNKKRQGVHYASVLENGAAISAKNSKWLTIYLGMGGNKKLFRKVESVAIPPRPFFEPVVNDYWRGGGFKAKKFMEEGLEKEIKKYVENKGGGLVIVDTEE